jgi:hypothetical protein
MGNLILDWLYKNTKGKKPRTESKNSNQLIRNIRVFGDRRTEAFDPLPAWRHTEPARPSTCDQTHLL